MAAQVPDQRAAPVRQADYFEDVRNALLDLLAAGVRRQAQLGRVAQGGGDGQGVVQDILLRHDRDDLLQGGEVGVKALAVDQHLGGIVIWIPAGMMSAIGFMTVLNALRRFEDSLSVEEAEDQDDGTRIVLDSAAWTGRR